MTKSKATKGEPFSVRFSAPTDRAVADEARRSRRSKSAVVEALTEEAMRTRRFPGIGFRGEDARRRPWVIGTGLDVWEICELLEEAGSIEEVAMDTHLVERQLQLALAYRERYPDEIAEAIAENRRPADEWQELYPFVRTPTTSEWPLRVLLDANLSSPRIGGPLREQGHDVRGVADEPDLEGLDDESVLELARQDERILITRNSRDFAPICRIWAEAGRDHAGVILIWSLSHRQYGEIICGVGHWLAQIPSAAAWHGTIVSL